MRMPSGVATSVGLVALIALAGCSHEVTAPAAAPAEPLPA